MKKMTAIMIALLLALCAVSALCEEQLRAHLGQIVDPQDPVAYTISTVEYGPLEPGSMDPVPFAALLLDMKLEPADLSLRPDGEYVVLHFPDENLYYYFFLADGRGDLILQTDAEGREELFRAVAPEDRAAAADVMSAWYYSLAEDQGLIEE